WPMRSPWSARLPRCSSRTPAVESGGAPAVADHQHEPAAALGDFTATPRMLAIAGLAVVIGVVSVFVAQGLLVLIDAATNLFFYLRFSTERVSPVDSTLGWFAVLVPVVGGLLIGLMARYGSDRIRGHGIPEAIEAILINGSRVQPKVRILKP